MPAVTDYQKKKKIRNRELILILVYITFIVPFICIIFGFYEKNYISLSFLIIIVILCIIITIFVFRYISKWRKKKIREALKIRWVT